MELNKAQLIMDDLIHYHLGHSWMGEFKGSKKVFGTTYYHTKTIKLSRYLVELNSEETVLNTILHEIAHGLEWADGHGKMWQATCKRIGGDGRRCYDVSKVIRPVGRYQYQCPKCGLLPIYRYRLTRNAHNHIPCGNEVTLVVTKNLQEKP